MAYFDNGTNVIDNIELESIVNVCTAKKRADSRNRYQKVLKVDIQQIHLLSNLTSYEDSYDFCNYRGT